jgi:hypothetical protein
MDDMAFGYTRDEIIKFADDNRVTMTASRWRHLTGVEGGKLTVERTADSPSLPDGAVGWLMGMPVYLDEGADG